MKIIIYNINYNNYLYNMTCNNDKIFIVVVKTSFGKCIYIKSIPLFTLTL